MCVADVTRADESVNAYFCPNRNKITKIMKNYQKHVQYITTIGTIFCVAVI